MQFMLKRYTTGLIILGIAIVLSGCWDNLELDEISIITGMGYEKKQEQVYLTTVAIEPAGKKGGESQTGGEGKKYSLFSAAGKTAVEASRNMQLLLPRLNYWDHCELMAISEKTAKEEGVRHLIEFFSREPARRNTAQLIVTAGAIEEIFNVPPVLADDPATEILMILREVEVTGKGLNIPLYRFIADSESLSKTALAGYFTIKDYGGSEEISGRKKEKVMVGSAVFYDYKLRGFLTPDEMFGVNWLQGMVKEGVISVASQEEGHKDTAVKIIQAKTKVEPYLSEQRALVKVKISIIGEIVEYLGSDNLRDRNVVSNLAKRCSKEVENLIGRTWEKAQQDLEADVFRLYEKFKRRYPRLTELNAREWLDIFLSIEPEITVETEIVKTGIRT